MSVVKYLQNLLRDPSVASVAPSSRYTVERVCKNIDFPSTKLIVEYGPGLGVFTRYLLERMPERSRLIAFERNPDFAKALLQRIPDPRLCVINVSAERALEFVAASSEHPADHVISGIPFSLISPEGKRAIVESTAKLLAPHGTFLTYQVFPPPASLDKHLKTFLEPHFELTRVEYEFRNVPPLRIYESRRKEG